MFTLTGIVESSLDHTHLKGKVTLKQDRLIFWNYDYNNTRHTHTVPFSSLAWHYWRRRDTAGQEYHYWYTYTGQEGWDRNEYKLGEINFQTWDWRSVWIGAKYQQKKDYWVHETVRIDLDDKSVMVFANYFNQFMKRRYDYDLLR